MDCDLSMVSCNRTVILMILQMVVLYCVHQEKWKILFCTFSYFFYFFFTFFTFLQKSKKKVRFFIFFFFKFFITFIIFYNFFVKKVKKSKKKYFPLFLMKCLGPSLCVSVFQPRRTHASRRPSRANIWPCPATSPMHPERSSAVVFSQICLIRTYLHIPS